MCKESRYNGCLWNQLSSLGHTNAVIIAYYEVGGIGDIIHYNDL